MQLYNHHVKDFYTTIVKSNHHLIINDSLFNQIILIIYSTKI